MIATPTETKRGQVSKGKARQWRRVEPLCHALHLGAFMHARPGAYHAPLITALLASHFGLWGCSEQPSTEIASTKAAQAVYPPGALEKTLVPLRSLQVPAGVYIKSIDETYATTGNLPHSVYLYQPDATGEAVRVELSAKTSGGTVDASHQFTSVSLTSHPGASDQSVQALNNAAGAVVYSIATSQPGWYRFSFAYGAVNVGRTLSIKAYAASGTPLKMAWTDPPGTNVQVRTTVTVEQTTNTFLKGGAYRNTDATQYAYADYVKVDGNLLYRRAFDQGQFNFPLGTLAAGQHTVEFSLVKSTGMAKFWFGVNDTSFDPLNGKSGWSSAQFLYWGSMHTSGYDAWNEGVAFAQGASAVIGVRPPPIRRGTSFSLALDHTSLAGTGNAILRIYPLGSGSETNWPAALSADSDYKGGIMTASGFTPRYREHWKVNVPANAPVGRYVVRAFAPTGAQVGTDVVFYVLHNPYGLVTQGAISKAELETFAYDEDEDGADVLANFGTDADNGRAHFTAIYPGSIDWGYTQVSKITGAFRRTNSDTGLSMLDYAMASAQGTSTEFESMRRLYRLASQHLRYTHYDIQDDSSMTFFSYGDGTGFSLDAAATYSKPGTELPATNGGQCQDYSTILAALARSSGMVARAISSQSGLGGWADHYFTEVYISDLPHHGGKTARTGGTASDTDPWYVFDATDPKGSASEMSWGYYGEAIAPRAEYGRAMLTMLGPPYGTWDVSTTKLGWDPLNTGTVYASDVTSVANAYSSGPEFWLTISGVTGWIGFGDKDVYRISKETTGAKAVRVRTLPSGGEYVAPVLCVAPASPSLALPAKCEKPAARQTLPAGESYVVVFNNTPDVNFSRVLRGDTIQYVLELEY